jgi:hypothetical protein
LPARSPPFVWPPLERQQRSTPRSRAPDRWRLKSDMVFRPHSGGRC